MLSEKAILTYFHALDADQDGLLSESDLSVILPLAFDSQQFFRSVQIPIRPRDIQTIIRHADGVTGISFNKCCSHRSFRRSFNTLLVKEKEITERVDVDVRATVKERGDTVSETEIQAIRVFIEPVLLLYRGIHVIDRLLTKRTNRIVRFLRFSPL